MSPPLPSSDAVFAERGALKMDVKPDLILLSSAMGKSVKEVQGVLVVNPGRLCKIRLVDRLLECVFVP
jgi:hypothetical protein